MRSFDREVAHRELLELAKRGDEEAMNTLCAYLRTLLWPILCSRLSGRPREDREDVLQATLLTFCERLPEIRDSALSYAYVIMRNKIGNLLQRDQKARSAAAGRFNASSNKKGMRLDDAAAGHDSDPANRTLVLEQAERLMSAMSSLQSFCRIIFSGLLSGRSLKEIWEDISQVDPKLKRGTFDKRVFACRRKLRSVIGGEFQ